MNERKKPENLALPLFCLLFFILQLIYVRFGQIAIPITSVSDDRIYLRLGQNIANLEAPYTFQYPLLYPLVIAAAVPFQSSFGLNAVFAANILLKLFGIVIVARQLRAFLPGREAVAVTALMALSPVSFLYSARIMSENVFVPLLLIALLFHLRHRGALVDDGTAFFRKLGLTAAAAFLAYLLLQTKYLSIVLMPVFCLLWGMVCLNRGSLAGGTPVPRGSSAGGTSVSRGSSAGGAPVSRDFAAGGTSISRDSAAGGAPIFRRLCRTALWCALYTFIVLACVAAYALLLSAKMGTPCTFSFVKKTLGFGVATGPDATGGLRLLPQRKWLFCYGIYALLGAVLPLSVTLARADRKTLARNRAAAAAIAAVSVVLIYVSARHSSLAYYNADGHMEKLLGRYVSVVTPLMIWMQAVTCGGAHAPRRSRAAARARIAAAAVFAAAVILAAYLFLYRNIHGWDMAARFLADNRGLDLISFSKAGLPSVCLYLAAALFSVLKDGKWPYRICLIACFAWQTAFVFLPG